MRARATERPAPWSHRKRSISVAKINSQIEAWAAYLGLADWNIAFSSERVDKGCRSNVDIDALTRTAAIRVHAKTPVNQWDRQLVHELLHVLLAGLEDSFNIAVSGNSRKTDRVFRRMWARGQEYAIERLVDIIVGVPREEWESSAVWRTAFPHDA